MTVGELIEKLKQIDDKTIELAFFCPRCKELNEVGSMKSFGFVLKGDHK
jgi:phage FluMu protein Com